MSNKYVRKTGSDANAGTSKGAAYLTVLKALQNVSAGDTVYIGAGVYRESGLVNTNAGSAGSPITIQGDIDGSQTDDAGLVRITASADDNAFTNTNVFANTKNYITYDRLWLDFSSGSALKSTGTNNIAKNCWITLFKGTGGVEFTGVDCETDNCRVWNAVTGQAGIVLSGGGGIADSNYVQGMFGGGQAQGIAITVVAGHLTITAKNNFVRDITPEGGAPDAGIYMNVNSVANAIVNLYNNTIIRVKGGGANASDGILVANTVATTVPNIYNNYIQDVQSGAGTNNSYAIRIQGTAPSVINGDYNAWAICRDGVSGYTANTHDKNNASSYNAIIEPLPNGLGGQDLALILDSAGNCIDTGINTNAPTVDIRGFPRGGMFGWDIGAIERQGVVSKDATTYNVTPSTNIHGAGFQDFKIAVNSGKVYTITAQLSRDTAYGAGTQPSLTVLANGVGMSGTISFTGSADTFQSCAIPTTSMTASADGVITIRFQAYSTVANADAWIDSITVSEA